MTKMRCKLSSDVIIKFQARDRIFSEGFLSKYAFTVLFLL